MKLIVFYVFFVVAFASFSGTKAENATKALDDLIGKEEFEKLPQAGRLFFGRGTDPCNNLSRKLRKANYCCSRYCVYLGALQGGYCDGNTCLCYVD